LLHDDDRSSDEELATGGLGRLEKLGMRTAFEDDMLILLLLLLKFPLPPFMLQDDDRSNGGGGLTLTECMVDPNSGLSREFRFEVEFEVEIAVAPIPP
jgi:hypothetical protein